jgi:hypothetical protein
MALLAVEIPPEGLSPNFFAAACVFFLYCIEHYQHSFETGALRNFAGGGFDKIGSGGNGNLAC